MARSPFVAAHGKAKRIVLCPQEGPAEQRRKNQDACFHALKLRRAQPRIKETAQNQARQKRERFQIGPKQLVRKGGLEPPRFYPPDPKSGASANSATFAVRRIKAGREPVPRAISRASRRIFLAALIRKEERAGEIRGTGLKREAI